MLGRGQHARIKVVDPAEFGVRSQRAQSEMVLFRTTSSAPTKSVGPNLSQLPPLMERAEPPQCAISELLTVLELPSMDTHEAPLPSKTEPCTCSPCTAVAVNKACVETAVVMLTQVKKETPCSCTSAAGCFVEAAGEAKLGPTLRNVRPWSAGRI